MPQRNAVYDMPQPAWRAGGHDTDILRLAGLTPQAAIRATLANPLGDATCATASHFIAPCSAP